MVNSLHAKLLKQTAHDSAPCNTIKLHLRLHQQQQNASPRRLPASPQTIHAFELENPPPSNRETLLRMPPKDDFATYASFLRFCGNSNALSTGQHVHDRIVQNNLERDPFLGSLLTQMYVKCTSIDNARACFDMVYERNVFAWNFMLGAYVQHGQDVEAFHLFAQMQYEEVLPDKVTFVHILSACASQAALTQGKLRHVDILCIGFESNVFVATALVSMYAKCDSSDDAWEVFLKMPERNVVSWNAVIAAYGQHGLGNEAFQLFEQMQQEGVTPDKVTYVSTISACASHVALNKGTKIHARITSNALGSDVFVATALFNMYSKCGSLGDAWKIFEKMNEKNVVSWNAMIAAYAQHEHGKEALQLFVQMQQEGVTPDKVTFVSILAACASTASLGEGLRIHSQVRQEGCCSDLDVVNALINMYGRCGSVEDAQMMFEELPMRNIISWNVMIAGYAQCGHYKDALHSFDQLQYEGFIPDNVTFISILSSYTNPAALADGKRMHIRIKQRGFETDIVVVTALVNMYGKCGSLVDARRMFDKMTEYNVVSWNTMITLYAQNGHGKEALLLFDQMRESSIVPNIVTFVNLLSACATQASLTEGKQMHAYIRRHGFELDIVVSSALVNMYGKCGSLEDAQVIFGKMLSKDLVSWNSVITAYAQHGHAKKALQLYKQMQWEGTFPDKVTSLSVLTACSHDGLAEQAHHFLISIGHDQGTAPNLEHHDCLIDLLGRVGRLEEAEDLLNNMPFQPSAVSWMTLLGACRHQHDVERGNHIAKQIFELCQMMPPVCVILSNIYAAAGMADEADQIRDWMRYMVMSGQLDWTILSSSIESMDFNYDVFPFSEIEARANLQ